MRKLIVLVLVAVAGFVASSRAQLLLLNGQSYAWTFSDLAFFGDGFQGFHPNGINFATFYSDSNGTTPGSTFRVDIFESNTGETPLASASGSGFVTAQAIGGWHDLQGVAMVTVTFGTVLFDTVTASVYKPTGFGEFESYSATTAVPEPGSVTLCALGLLGLAGWGWRRRSCAR